MVWTRTPQKHVYFGLVDSLQIANCIFSLNWIFGMSITDIMKWLQLFLFTSHLQARQRPPLHGLRLQEGAAGHCHPVVRGLQPLQGPNPASFLL